MIDTLVLTGPRGAGKTALRRRLLSIGPHFELVPAVTTRGRRRDDADSEYIYLDGAAFEAMERAGHLILSSAYGGARYGIRHDDYAAARVQGIALLTLSPRGALRFREIAGRDHVSAVFVYAGETALDNRLSAREHSGRPANWAEVLRQRHDDLMLKDRFEVVVRNDVLESAMAAILTHVGARRP